MWSTKSSMIPGFYARAAGLQSEVSKMTITRVAGNEMEYNRRLHTYRKDMRTNINAIQREQDRLRKSLTRYSRKIRQDRRERAERLQREYEFDCRYEQLMYDIEHYEELETEGEEEGEVVEEEGEVVEEEKEETGGLAGRQDAVANKTDGTESFQGADYSYYHKVPNGEEEGEVVEEEKEETGGLAGRQDAVANKTDGTERFQGADYSYYHKVPNGNSVKEPDQLKDMSERYGGKWIPNNTHFGTGHLNPSLSNGVAGKSSQADGVLVSKGSDDAKPTVKGKGVHDQFSSGLVRSQSDESNRKQKSNVEKHEVVEEDNVQDSTQKTSKSRPRLPDTRDNIYFRGAHGDMHSSQNLIRTAAIIYPNKYGYDDTKAERTISLPPVKPKPRSKAPTKAQKHWQIVRQKQIGNRRVLRRMRGFRNNVGNNGHPESEIRSKYINPEKKWTPPNGLHLPNLSKKSTGLVTGRQDSSTNVHTATTVQLSKILGDKDSMNQNNSSSKVVWKSVFQKLKVVHTLGNLSDVFRVKLYQT